MIGSKALSCSWPASEAMVTVTSLPITSKATWFMTSGITGLTLPGMMDEPAWRAGSRMSPKPACGPLESRRRSLQILLSLVATRLSTPDSCTKAPVSCVASIRLAACSTGTPHSSARWRQTMFGIAGRRVDAGAYGRGAQVDFLDQRAGLAQAGLVLADHDRVGQEFLAQRHGHGVLQLGAADLQHVPELVRPWPRSRARRMAMEASRRSMANHRAMRTAVG